MVERLPKDADGVLSLVSPHVGFHIYIYIYILHINGTTIDQSVLCRSRNTPWRDRPGPRAKQSGYLILPLEHLSGSHRFERNTHIYSIPYRQTTAVLSSEIYRQGEFSGF
jgi:hypothetical protein